ncbi:hypothetical protein BDZ91DRAFT_697017 [Kalaharituber pfeilii]|nr:hypothetical protein BDZ91DRAFT_697017 [Kalaharituber pfeilii]
MDRFSSILNQTQRDHDLLEPDNFLTDAQLDTLWDWFCLANREKVDPQMVFVKLVNSVRKQYRKQQLAPMPEFFHPGSSQYTPTEFASTIGDAPQVCECGNEALVQKLRTRIEELETDKENQQALIHELQTKVTTMDQVREEYHRKIESQKAAQAEFTAKMESEKKTLESRLKAKMEDEKRTLESNFKAAMENEKRTLESTLKAKMEGEKRTLESNLKAAMENEKRTLEATLKAKMEGEKRALESNLKAAMENEKRTLEATLKAKMEGEKRALESNLKAAMDSERKTLESKLSVLKAECDALRISNGLAKIRVAIKSVAYNNNYVQMKVKQGRAFVGPTISACETFELQRHAGGTVSFKSTCLPQSPGWLSAKGEKVRVGEISGDGGGVVDCQKTCGKYEKFHLRWLGHGQVGIELQASPGRFLRLCGGKVNVQGGRRTCEMFYLVVIP